MRAWSERGQGVVEFALILPVFMLLILGLLDFGSAYNIHNDMQQLAGEAARFAAVDNCGGTACTGGTIAAQVRSDADNGCLQAEHNCRAGYPGPQHQLSICFYYPKSGDVGDPVTAVVSTTYEWLPFLDLGTNINLSATATMRIEQPETSGAYTPDPACSS